MKRFMLFLIYSVLFIYAFKMNLTAQYQPKKQQEKQEQSDQNQNSDVPITDIEVKADKPGSAAAGYRVDSLYIGPLGKKKPLDIPYQINAVPNEMVQNQQVTTLAEVMRNVPSAQMEARGGMTVGRPQTRGFQGSVSENNRMDGMNIAVTTAYPMEQFEQIEILNGLSGSFYGPATPSGTFNFILKRPTEKPLYSFTLGNVSYWGTANDDPAFKAHDHTFVHADLGGPLGKNFGYRVNIVHDEGEEYVAYSKIKRDLASMSFDWHILPNTVAELNFSYYDYVLKGVPASFGYSDTIPLPDAKELDPTLPGYGQPWAGHHLSTRTTSARIKHDFNSDWNLTVGLLNQEAIRRMFTVSNTFTNLQYDFTTKYGTSTAASEWRVDSGILNLNGRVKTGIVTHDLVIGTNGHRRIGMSGKDTSTTKTLGTSSMKNPKVYDEPTDWHLDNDIYKGSQARMQSVTVGDTLTYKSFSAMISGSYCWMDSISYNTDGTENSHNKEEGISPAGSLMYRPFEKMMTYVSYSDSLQQGAVASGNPKPANDGEVMPAYRSRQYEVGVKAEVNKMDLSAAAFRINRPLAYVDTDNVFKVKGNQVNYGVEAMAKGKFFDRFTTYAGYTFLDPRLKDTKESSTNNQLVIGVPRHQGNLYVEYRTPFINGLTPSVNIHYMGKRAANGTNTDWAEAYTTIDVGIRYACNMLEEDTTFKFTVNNVTNQRYWASIMPGSTEGVGTTNSAFLGTPREFIASMQLAF
jgi:iron complex outermembrane recepter protein